MATRLSGVALLVGGVLALPVAAFVAVYDGRPVLATALALCLFLPFAAYAVRVDRDPGTLLPPRGVVAAGGGVGALVVSLGALTGAFPMGLAAGALAVAAALDYHGRYATVPFPARLVAVGGGALTLAAVAAGALADAPVASGVAGAATAGATVDYLRERRWLTRRTRRVAASVALLGGAGVVVLGVLLDHAATGVAWSAALLVVGAALAVE